MTLTNIQYLNKFYHETDLNKTAFKRHLEVCGIKTKNDKKTRAKKFLWGMKDLKNTITWVPLTSLTFEHRDNIRSDLTLKKLSTNDESIDWIIDLLDYAQDNGLYR